MFEKSNWSPVIREIWNIVFCDSVPWCVVIESIRFDSINDNSDLKLKNHNQECTRLPIKSVSKNHKKTRNARFFPRMCITCERVCEHPVFNWIEGNSNHSELLEIINKSKKKPKFKTNQIVAAQCYVSTLCLLYQK